MNKFFTFAFALVLCGSAIAAGNPKNGESLYKKCASCHGGNGQGNKSQEAPRIAGQHEWYLVSTVVDMQTGKRSNPKMIPFIKNLTKQEIEDLASYITTLE
ncbi:MAG: c-type cytochrome [Bacteriovoracaceae bacterium]